jgi:S1-C subfamily serine protease
VKLLALIPPAVPDCVVAIGIGESANRHWVASGFFYGYADVVAKDKYHVYLITNKHVFNSIRKIGVTKAYIRVNPKANQEAKTYEVELVDEKGKALWYLHPDPKVDVAAVPINFAILQGEGMRAEFFQSDKHAYTAKKLQEMGITEGDFTYALGFPMNLVGDQRNTVIVRGGVVARIQDVYQNPRKDFLIDAAIFPGNSGGPVILKPELISIQGTKSHSNASLIGIIRGYISYADEAVSKQTGETRIIFQENSGLAIVHTVDCIDETIQEHIKTLKPSEPS